VTVGAALTTTEGAFAEAEMEICALGAFATCQSSTKERAL